MVIIKLICIHMTNFTQLKISKIMRLFRTFKKKRKGEPSKSFYFNINLNFKNKKKCLKKFIKSEIELLCIRKISIIQNIKFQGVFQMEMHYFSGSFFFPAYYWANTQSKIKTCKVYLTLETYLRNLCINL